jgi:hypothetical protein
MIITVIKDGIVQILSHNPTSTKSDARQRGVRGQENRRMATGRHGRGPWSSSATATPVSENPPAPLRRLAEAASGGVGCWNTLHTGTRQSPRLAAGGWIGGPFTTSQAHPRDVSAYRRLAASPRQPHDSRGGLGFTGRWTARVVRATRCPCLTFKKGGVSPPGYSQL